MTIDYRKMFSEPDDTMMADVGIGSDYPAMADSAPTTFAVGVPTIRSDVPRKPGWIEDYGWRGVIGGLERGITGIGQMFLDVEDATLHRASDGLNNAINSGLMAVGIVPHSLYYRDGRLSWEASRLNTETRSLRDMVQDAGGAKVFIPETDRFGAKLVQTVSSFAVPFKAAKVGLEGAAVFSAWGKFSGLGYDVAASAASAFAQLDPLEGNLANVAETFGLDRSAIGDAIGFNSLVDILKVNPDDDAIEARLKNSVTDFGASLALTGAASWVTKSLKQLRAAKAAKLASEATDAADEVVLPVSQLGDHADTLGHIEGRIAETAGEQLELFPGASLGAAGAGDATGRAVGEAIDTVEKMVLNIDRKGATVTDAEIAQLAQQFTERATFEGIERIGVNPARLDFGKWLAAHADPATAKAAIEDVLHRISSSDVGQRLANAMGSQRRTDEAAAFLAKMIGSNVTDVVNGIKDKTANLDVYVRAASALVGGETQKLIALAERLQALLAKGEFSFDNPAHPAYVEFLKQFETLTTLQSAMRGSFSEMGRGLRSIQAVNSARTAKADLELARSVMKDPAATSASDAAKASWDEKLRQLADAKTPAQRKALLDQVLKANGDLAGVARNVATGEGTFTARAFRWIRETSANLFSVGTATTSAIGMGAYHSIDLLAGLVHEPLAYLTRNDEFRIAAAVNRAKWGTLVPAYMNGLVRAFQVTGAEMIREGGRVADGLGSKGLSASEKATRAAVEWERHFGSLPVMEGDRFGRSVVGAVVNKFHRSDLPRDPAIYLSPADVDALLASDNHGPAVFAAAARSIVGLAVNTFGAATRSGRIATIEFLDELTGSAVYGAHRYAEAVGLATRQGIKAGLSGRAFAAYAERTAKRLVSSTSRDTAATLQNLVEAGSANKARIEELAKDVIQRHGIEEIAAADARRILFQDDLQTGLAKTLKGIAAYDPGGIIAPFVHTPLRILETGLLDFTPLGFAKRSLRADLRSGGPKSAEALAKIGMGTMMMLLGYNMAAAGSVVGYDGGATSASRLGRPQYSLKVGDRWVEFGRIDPLAMILGIGADIYQFERMAEENDLGGDVSMSHDLAQMAEAGLMALTTNALSQTYLQGLKSLAQIADVKQADIGWQQLISGLVQRAVPLGGVQKGITGEATNEVPHTSDPANYWAQLRDRFIGSTVFAPAALNELRDPFLGQPIPYDRVLGVKTTDAENDPLYREMAELAFRTPQAPRSINGVKLTGAQQYRLLQRLGDTKIGDMTLAERLRDYVTSPEWSGYTAYQKVELMKVIRMEYYELAKTDLLAEDKSLRIDTETTAFRKELTKAGVPSDGISAQVRAFRTALEQQQ